MSQNNNKSVKTSFAAIKYTQNPRDTILQAMSTAIFEAHNAYVCALKGEGNGAKPAFETQDITHLSPSYKKELFIRSMARVPDHLRQLSDPLISKQAQTDYMKMKPEDRRSHFDEILPKVATNECVLPEQEI